MSNFKKVLLTGTALIAAAGFTASAQAQSTITLGGDVQLDATAFVDNDNVELDGNNLTVDDDNDGGAIGTITDTNATPDGNVTFDSAGSAEGTGLTISTGAITLGTGNLVIQSTDGDDAGDDPVSVTTTGAVSVNDLSVVADGTDTDGDATYTVVGNVTTAGNVVVTADAAAAALDVTGALNSTGNITLTSSATDTATLAVSGDLTGATIVLDDTATGGVTLTLDGTAAGQTVTGVVSGSGDVTITNTHADGATFASNITNDGTITVNSDGNAQAVVFQGDVAAAIALGDNNGADAVTATIGSSSATAISNTITGGVAETVTLNALGGDTITVTGAIAGVDTLAVSGNTTLTTNQNLGATNITVASGSTLATTGSTVTGSVANSGTLLLNGGDVAGDVSGTGALDVDANATVTGDAGAASANVAAGVVLTVAGGAGNDYAVTTTTLTDATSGLTVTAGSNITGNIVAAVDGAGVITIGNAVATTAIAGNVGSSTAAVEDFVITDHADTSVVTTTGNLYVNDINLGEADTLSFIGTGTQVVSGTIDATNETGAGLSVGNATDAVEVTFNGVIGGSGNIDNLTVNDNATAIFTENATFDGAFSADAATVRVDHDNTLTVATLTDADVTAYQVEVNKVGGGAQTNSTYIASDAFDFATGGADTVHVVVEAGSAPLTTGASVLDNVFQGNAAANVTGVTVTDNSFIYAFSLVADTNNVDITVTEENSVASFAESAANSAAGTALLSDLAASTDIDLNTIQGNLAAAETADAANDILESVVSDVSAGAAVAGFTVANQTAQITGQRLASLRTGTGVAAGGHMDNGLKAWGQVFGTTADQDKRDGVAGYDADTAGFAAGIDTELNDNAVVGLALSYANTEVDSEDANASSTDVDTYQVTVYGDYDIDENTFVNGQVSFAHGQNDTTRKNVGGTSDTAKGDFDSKQFGIRAEAGRSYDAGNGLTLVPSVLANYVHYDADSYTETGAGGANLTVDADSLNVFELGANVEVSTTQEFTDGSALKPSLNLGVRHDLVGDEFEASNTFAGGGSAFKVEGFDPAQTTLSLGAGVTYFSADQWELTAEYDFEAKSDYQSHSGLVKAAYKF